MRKKLDTPGEGVYFRSILEERTKKKEKTRFVKETSIYEKLEENDPVLDHNNFCVSDQSHSGCPIVFGNPFGEIGKSMRKLTTFGRR